ncbi:MAG: hypothetical protein AB1404_12460 [Spirochaetota bacterium]
MGVAAEPVGWVWWPSLEGGKGGYPAQVQFKGPRMPRLLQNKRNGASGGGKVDVAALTGPPSST